MELTQKQLEKLKLVETDMLREFIRVCETLNLQYYVLGGTLLGAVRHQGFIPWDDDIDVGMPREDYEVFLARAQELLPENLFLQTAQTDPNYPANFAKIRNSNTTFVEDSLRNCAINHGVYIDVFPLDYYPRKGQKMLTIRHTLLKLRISDAFSVNGMKRKTKLVRALTRFIYPTVTDAVAKREKLMKAFSEGEYLANHCGAWGVKEIIPAHWYAEGTPVTFEGIQVMAPVMWHEWLTQMYGDYMQLPPVEKRVAHHYVAAFDLMKPYTAYIERN